MGDRCWLSITFRREDAEVVDMELDIGILTHDYDDHPDWQEVRVEEANYGFYLDRERLADLGIVFFGRHGSGSEYGEAVFCSIDGESHDVPSLHDIANIAEPCVAVRAHDRKPCPEGLAEVAAFYDAMDRITELRKTRKYLVR